MTLWSSLIIKILTKGRYQMKKYPLLVILALGVVLIAGIQLTKPNATTLYAHGLAITGTITNQSDLEEAVAVVQQNLKAATEKDLNSYLDTLIASAQEETGKEMTDFFADYNLTHELLSLEVRDQQADRMLLKASQRTKKIDGQPQKENYRDHLSDANHTLIKEKGQWKIAETVMTSTSLLD